MFQELTDGALYALQAPLALGAVGAACLASRVLQGWRPLVAAMLVGGSAWFSLLAPDTWPATPVAGAAVVVLGALVAMGMQLRGAAAAAALITAGVVAGLACGLPTATLEERVGSSVVLVTLAVAVLLLEQIPVPPRLCAGASIGQRMVGAWLAAVGIILSTLWFRGI